MARWEIALLMTAAAGAMIAFTFQACRTFLRIAAILPRWAKENGYRIVEAETRIFFQGPFPKNRYSQVYFVTVEDQQQRQRKGWIRLGWWYGVGFQEKIEVRWEE